MAEEPETTIVSGAGVGGGVPVRALVHAGAHATRRARLSQIATWIAPARGRALFAPLCHAIAKPYR